MRLSALRQGARGVIECLSGQARFRGPNGPLNGQAARQDVVARIIRQCGIGRVIETGSFRGDSTAWFLARCGKVYSIEISPRFHWYCRTRFFGRPSVTLLLGNSAAVLPALLQRLAPGTGPTLCYLDAHWRAHLPLAEEVGAILDAPHDAVVVVDDFCVPDDPGYGYDDYGPGKTLDMAYLRAACRGQDIPFFFPSTPSDRESGRRRGWCTFANNARLAASLAGVSGLRRLT